MNPRIQELAQQATEDILGVPVLNQQRFAELIIKETLQVAQGALEYSTGLEESVHNYFGIKQK